MKDLGHSHTEMRLADKLYKSRLEVGRLREALEASRWRHHNCPEMYFDCPVFEWQEYQEGPRPECDCGADEANARIDAALKEAQP